MPQRSRTGAGPLRVYIAGHRGMVGSALVRRLQHQQEVNLVLRGRDELDLTRQSEVQQFFADEQIDQVYLAAARVGGILANSEQPADFIRENLLIQTHVIEAAHRAGVGRLLFLGSSCIYPRLAQQPMAEAELLTGPLEPTNEAYAIAKIAGMRMCEAYRKQYGSDFRSVMPTNLYGPGDNFDLQSSHVLPALLVRFRAAAQGGDSTVTVWGSGTPRREFLHVDDMAAACCFIMRQQAEAFWSAVPLPNSHVNVGCGKDISIAELARLVADETGFKGNIEFDTRKPDGAPRKLLDISRISAMGWAPEISLVQGIRGTLEWMQQHV